MGLAFTSIETGAVTEWPSVACCFGDGRAADWPWTIAAVAAVENPAADNFRKRRRQRLACMTLRMQAAAMAVRRRWRRVGLAEELGEFFGDGAAEFFGIDDGDRATVVACHVVADPDRDQFDRRARLDLLDDVAQMTLEIIA